MKEKPTQLKFFTQERIWLIVILFATFISYVQITHYGFIHWDDNAQITENAHVKSLNLHSLNYNLHQERYTFLTLTAFSAIYNVWGNNPVPFHGLSLLFHLLNIVLVFFLTKKLIQNIPVIIFVTLLFALHPLRVESVAWISEFKDVLFTFFSLISFHFYINYIQQHKFRYFIYTSIFVLLASFSKIQGLIIPLSLFLFDLYYQRKLSLLLVLEKVILFFYIFFIFKFRYVLILTISIVAIYLILRKKLIDIKLNSKTIIAILSVIVLVLLGYTWKVLVHFKSGLWSDVHVSQNSFSIIERFFLTGYALWFYLSNFIMPHSLNAVHPYPARLANGNLPQDYYLTLIVLFVVVVISILMIIKRKKIIPLLFFGWFFFLFNISMVLHIIPIEGRLVVADRYSYLAYFGLMVVFAVLIDKYLMVYIKKYATLIFSILLVMLSLSTYNRCMVWKDTKTLFTDVIHKNPDVSFAYLNLATIYLGQPNIDSAMYCYNQSVKLDSLEPTAYFNRASAFDMIGKNEQAIQDFKSALKYDEHNVYKAIVYTYMGESYRKMGKDSLSLQYYNSSIKEDSTLSLAYDNRGTFYLDKNMLHEANADFTKAIKLDKFNASAINHYGWILVLQGKYQDALNYFNQALVINPAYQFALNNRGYAEFMLGNITLALDDYNKALSINPRMTQAYLNRGWALAITKNFKEAIDDFSTVISLDNNNQLARNNRAYAWFSLKEYAKAFDDFKTNIDTHPNSAVAWQNMAWFHTQLKDYEKAITEFNKSLSLDGSLINSYINLGWIWHEKKNAGNAEMFYKKALSLNPQSGDAWFMLGELYRENKKIQEACDCYNKALNYGNKKANDALIQYCKK
jgi:tetratricopeptide (TPR) repeat protein